MKGVKTASFANGTATRFQSDHLLANKITLGGKDVREELLELKLKMKQLQEKVDSFETEPEPVSNNLAK